MAAKTGSKTPASPSGFSPIEIEPVTQAGFEPIEFEPFTTPAASPAENTEA
jgi:hypothetical protein